MTMSYRWTSAVLGVIIAITIVWLIRRDHMQTRYAYWWLVLAAVVVTLGIKPRIVDMIAKPLGVAYPPFLLVVVGMAFLLIKILTADIERSRQERRMRRLTQRLAMLEAAADETSTHSDTPAAGDVPEADRPPIRKAD